MERGLIGPRNCRAFCFSSRKLHLETPSKLRERNRALSGTAVIDLLSLIPRVLFSAPPAGEIFKALVYLTAIS